MRPETGLGSSLRARTGLPRSVRKSLLLYMTADKLKILQSNLHTSHLGPNSSVLYCRPISNWRELSRRWVGTLAPTRSPAA